MILSVIIPTYNEGAGIRNTIERLWQHDEAQLIKEIIIADGGSIDNTRAEANSEGVTITISPQKGRAAQMNFGASLASGDVLYFLHADTIPPINFTQDIRTAIDSGYDAGCYRLSFDHGHWFLKANSWFTRFDVNAFRYGDQSLFVTKKKFESTGGFSEKHIVMEDHHLIKRLKKPGRFKIIKKPVITSARKYVQNGVYKTQAIFYLIYFMYRMGFSQQKLLTIYRRLIKQDKL